MKPGFYLSLKVLLVSGIHFQCKVVPGPLVGLGSSSQATSCLPPSHFLSPLYPSSIIPCSVCRGLHHSTPSTPNHTAQQSGTTPAFHIFSHEAVLNDFLMLCLKMYYFIYLYFKHCTSSWCFLQEHHTPAPSLPLRGCFPTHPPTPTSPL